jgi:hypothetical protein
MNKIKKAAIEIGRWIHYLVFRRMTEAQFWELRCEGSEGDKHL